MLKRTPTRPSIRIIEQRDRPIKRGRRGKPSNFLGIKVKVRNCGYWAEVHRRRWDPLVRLFIIEHAVMRPCRWGRGGHERLAMEVIPALLLRILVGPAGVGEVARDALDRVGVVSIGKVELRATVDRLCRRGTGLRRWWTRVWVHVMVTVREFVVVVIRSNVVMLGCRDHRWCRVGGEEDGIL